MCICKSLCKWQLWGVAILLILALPLAAEQPRTGGILKAAVQTNPPTLDVHMSATAVSKQIGIYMFEGLVTFGESYEVIPQLASSWEASDDRLVYTFHLRSGVKFHNGKELTSEDVVASIDRYLAHSPGANRLAAVDDISAVDPLTVRITLKEPTLLPVILAMQGFAVVIYPAEIVAGRESEIRGDELVGTGPYEFVEWRPDAIVKLKRFEDYVPDSRFDGPSGFGGKRTPYFDEIHFLPVQEQSSRLAGLLTGEFDYAEALSSTSYDQLQANPNVTARVVRDMWSVLISINKAEPPTDNVYFRQAVVAALDMEEVMKAVTFNNPEFYNLQPSFYFPQQTVWWNDAGAAIYNHQDLDVVQQLLNKAGYNFEPIVYLSNRGYDWMYKASIAVASQLQQAGINVVIEFSDWVSQVQRAVSLEGWHLNSEGWSPRFDPSQYLSNFGCGATYGYGYCNPEADELAKQLAQDRPIEERQALHVELQELIWNDVPIIRIGDLYTLEATTASLRGYTSFYVTPRFWDCWKE